MAKKPAKRKRRSRHEPLVHGHLERVSRTLLEKHGEIVRRFIGRNTGVYALYRKNRLYYVGLASKLSGRLKAHLRDRHSNSWDQFSIYLTIRDQHLKEIESLLLRIARPTGNRVTGKTARSQNLSRRLQDAVKEGQRKEINLLFNRSLGATKTQSSNSRSTDANRLASLFPDGARLRGTNNGEAFHARIGRNGQLRFQSKAFTSLSAAARAAVGRSVNGWWFWQVERGKKHWVRLREIRRVGTAIYRSR